MISRPTSKGEAWRVMVQMEGRIKELKAQRNELAERVIRELENSVLVDHIVEEYCTVCHEYNKHDDDCIVLKAKGYIDV